MKPKKLKEPNKTKKLTSSIKQIKTKKHSNMHFNPIKVYTGMNIYRKLSVSFLAIAIVCNLLIGLVGVLKIQDVNNMSQKIYTEDMVPLAPLNQIETNFLQMNAKVNGNDVYSSQSAIMDLSDQLNKELSQYSKTITDPKEKETVKQMTLDICDYMIEITQILSQYAIGDTAAAAKIIDGDLAKTSTHFDGLVKGLFETKIQQSKQSNEQNQRNFITSLITLGMITLASIIISALAGRMNAKLISNPINKLVKSADAIAQGNLDIEIDKGNGDEITTLANSFEKIVASLRFLREDISMLIDSAMDGNLSLRADSSRQQGAYKNIIEDVNKLLDTITVPFNTAADYIDEISRGDIPELITDDFKGDFNKIKVNLNTCINSVNALIEDAEMLSGEAVKGNLSVRADVSRHNGDFGKVIEGVNNTLDAITIPLNTASDYIDDISRGNIPEIITDEYKGEFNRIKESLNTCIISVNSLIEDANMLSKAAVAGDLSVRADAGRHNGDFGKVIDGVNNALDSVINPLRLAKDYVGRISRGEIPEKQAEEQNGEYEDFRTSINTCIDAVNLLVEDANMLSEASTRGDLSVRADSERHQGDFKKIIEGVNNTFEAVAKPVSEAVVVLSDLSKGNLSTQVTGEYKGDLAAIKESINGMATAWSVYINEISKVLSQMAEGNLDVEINSDFKGDFVKIKDSINNIITAFNEVIGEIIIASDGITSGSKQVAEGSQSLSSGASEQAASIEQLTASISDIAEKTKENAMHAANADNIANSLKDNAASGEAKMGQMLGSMTEISEAASSISKIIRVINDIAFQTNILALNAAIEAARAGTYGKGFAVVAEEVRNLAARSANAAKDTTQMIDISIGKATEGTEIARDTSNALKMIGNGVVNTAEIIDKITASSDEQATGIMQINKGIDQVSKIVQTNSATAEQSAAASEELFSQAESMKKLVGRFTLKTDNPAE
jgi:methyl-accepting chemotaxis protein